MKSNFFFSLVMLLSSVAFGEAAVSLSDFVAKESGIDLGPCELSPKPQIAGEEIHLVIPARFEDPKVWATRTLLLVGVTAEQKVTTHLELKTPDQIFPRDLISAACKANSLTIKVSSKKSPKTIRYTWDGKTLTTQK